MFVGREKELNDIVNILKENNKKCILLYGKRRVGKSYLINEALKHIECKYIYYECIQASYEENLNNLEKRIKLEFNNKYVHFESFEEIFDYLGSLNQKVTVVFDEYSNLKSSREKNYIDSLFQRIIDQMSSNIHLVLLGSYVSVMKELLEDSNPLFGRFVLTMNLQPFDYYDSSLFYKDKNVKEKIELYSVFGGLPFVNDSLFENKTLKENIIKLLLNSNSSIRSYLEHILLSELSKVSSANDILYALSNGKKKYNEIENRIHNNSNGALDKQLKNLINMQIITKTSPINKRNDKRKTFYEIQDNLVRFYYNYIFSNTDLILRIGEEAYYNLYIEPTINTFISHRFEDIVKEYFTRKVVHLELNDIYDIGSYWYDLPKERKNGEFDCVLKHRDSYSFYEVKYYQQPMKIEEIEEEIKQVQNIVDSMEIKEIGFVCLSGFEDCTGNNFISGNQLY